MFLSVLRSKIFKNFSYLSIWQVIGFVFSLITFPYITRIFGPANYGLLNFIQSFVSYFAFFSDYGIGMIAPSLLAVVRDDLRSLSVRFSSILIVKFFLAVCVIPFLFFFTLKTSLKDYFYYVFIISLGSILFNNLNSPYFFQAMEEMRYITYLNFLSRFVTVMLIFILVKKSSDVAVYLWINSGGILLLAVSSLLVVYFKYKVKLVLPTFNDLYEIFKRATAAFISLIFMNIYSVSNTVFLGFSYDSKEVGFYSGAYRIVSYLLTFIFLFSQALFPRMSIVSQKSIYDAFVKAQKAVFYISPIIFAFSVLLFIFSKQIVMMLLGFEFLYSSKIVKIISFSPLLIFVSNMFGIQIILSSGRMKEFFYLSITGFFVNILSNIFITLNYGAIGAAITFLITEFAVMVISYLLVRRILVDEGKRSSSSYTNL